MRGEKGGKVREGNVGEIVKEMCNERIENRRSIGSVEKGDG